MSSHDVHVVVPNTVTRASITSSYAHRSTKTTNNNSSINKRTTARHGRRWPSRPGGCCWSTITSIHRHHLSALVFVTFAFLLFSVPSLVLIVSATQVPSSGLAPALLRSSPSFFYFFSSLTATAAKMASSFSPSFDKSSLTAKINTTVSSISGSSSFSSKFSTTTVHNQTINGFDEDASEVERSNRSPRAANSNNNNREFRILALLPDEYGPNIVRMLRDSQASWEKSGIISGLSKLPTLDGYNINQNGWRRRGSKFRKPVATVSTSSATRSVLRAADMPLSIVSEPVNNDTERLMSSVGNWVTTHQPVLILSFLDRARNFYAQLVARAAGMPIVSMTRTYQDQFDSQLYSRKGVKVSVVLFLFSLLL